MTELATSISKQLIGLPSDEQIAVLHEVRNRVEDHRARRAYDSYLSGNSETGDFETSLKELERKYGV